MSDACQDKVTFIRLQSAACVKDDSTASLNKCCLFGNDSALPSVYLSLQVSDCGFITRTHGEGARLRFL